jgi:hypothetical protein
MVFHHADAAWTTRVDSVMDSTRDYGFYSDANLEEYLRRPVRLLDQDWTVTTGTVNVTLDPWTLFLEDTNVKNRIEGYRLFQGTLHIRIAINGGPFFYGRSIAAYKPRAPDDDHSFGAATSEYYKQQLSMLPHVYIDPTTSEGGEIICPFLCPENWIDLVGESYKKMGRLYIVSLNDLLHANASTATVNISAYAWMTDVRLAGPTMRDMGLFTAHNGTEVAYGAASVSVLGAVVAWMRHIKCSYIGEDRSSTAVVPAEVEDMEAQSGDEYGTGIISRPASSIAKYAGMLSKIPIIKPYARPTEIVASVIGRVAHVFGYSRPTIISDIERVKNKGAGNLVNTDQHEAVVKLTLDSKQELTIDPRTVGLSDVDEMSFNYIKQKECYMSTIEWNESQVSDTALGTISIGPDFHNTATINSVLLNMLAPMYTVAAPFMYWRGSIKLRFQLVASQLHRGRLRFSYDPYNHSASPGENQTYQRIVDLATNRDFEMVVSWNQPNAWLQVKDRLGNTYYNHPVGTVDFDADNHNGQVRIEVVNELTSPDPALAQPVYINLFVSAGEDFEVAGPTDDMLKYCEFEPQSGAEGEELIEETDNVPESPAPIAPIGQQESLDNPNSHVFFGESFASVRALLKRYNYHMTYNISATSDYSYSVDSNFPTEKGQSVAPRSSTASTTTPPSTAYTFCAMTYLNWFVPCYVAWRGGLRSKYIAPDLEKTHNIYIRRLAQPVAQANCRDYFRGITAGNPQSDFLAGFGSWAGADYTVSHTDGAAEVEFPFYSWKRFAPARRFLNGYTTNGLEMMGENAGHIVLVHPSTACNVQRYVAAGDDFSCFMFIGSPGILRRAVPKGAGSTATLPSY